MGLGYYEPQSLAKIDAEAHTGFAVAAAKRVQLSVALAPLKGLACPERLTMLLMRRRRSLSASFLADAE